MAFRPDDFILSEFFFDNISEITGKIPLSTDTHVSRHFFYSTSSQYKQIVRKKFHY